MVIAPGEERTSRDGVLYDEMHAEQRKRVTAGGRSEASSLNLIKTAALHIPPMTSIAPFWYVLLTI